MSTIIFIYIILFIIILLVGYNIKSIEKFKNSKSCINEKNIKTCNTRYNCVWCDVENNCININNFTRENCFKPPVIKKINYITINTIIKYLICIIMTRTAYYDVVILKTVYY